MGVVGVGVVVEAVDVALELVTDVQPCGPPLALVVRRCLPHSLLRFSMISVVFLAIAKLGWGRPWLLSLWSGERALWLVFWCNLEVSKSACAPPLYPFVGRLIDSAFSFHGISEPKI